MGLGALDAHMAEVRTNGRQASEPDESVFECAVCGATRAASAVDYNQLGYATCPVCTYSHGPSLTS